MSTATDRLLQRLLDVQDRVGLAVELRRAGDPRPEDPFRGLYVDEPMVDHLLAREGPDAAALPDRLGEPAWLVDPGSLGGAGASGPEEEDRVLRLARAFALTELDVRLLLTALICEVDPRMELLFGYLNDDVTRRRPTVAVALTLCGTSVANAAARHRLEHGPLVACALLVVDDVERPFPGRGLRLPDRVVDHLLGSDAPDAALRDVLAPAEPIGWGDSSRLSSALGAGVALVHLRESPTGSGRLLAVGALERLGRGGLVVDAHALAAAEDPRALAALAAREARLRGDVLVVCDVDALAGTPHVLRRLLDPAVQTVAVGTGTWDPAWSATPALQLAVPASTAAERSALWEDALELPPGGRPGTLDPVAATAPFRLRPEQVARAARTARNLSRMDGRLTADHVRRGALGENGTALERLARRIEPSVGWDDLVLPPAVLGALREIALRARFREQVLGDWRMRPGGGRGIGVAALFAGDSGTGKTMSAEVVAHELGLELYVVDLATVVDKYIGETEKNLERIFEGAAGVNAVLLFDEADSIFGRRTEVRDSHDRYANIESAYLLQRMESFDGLCILATNLRANIDEAFTRRLDVLVDFPLPDAEQRLALWDRSLGRAIPRAGDVDLEFCAEAFEMAGGAIRSACVTAAYLAAADGGVVSMTHLVSAVHREYRKLGRLTLEHEFGRYWGLLDRA